MTAAASYGTANRIIRDAMQDAGKLQNGEDPSSEDFANLTNRLNDLINFWQTQGIKLWTLVDQSVTLVAGQALYTIFPGGNVSMTKPLRVEMAYFLDADSNKTPLTVMSWDEYTRLSNVTSQGALNSYFVDKQQTMLKVFFWLVPDTQAALGTAHLVLRQQIVNFTGITDALNFPPEWYIALRWGLADEISTGQPQTIMDRCAQRAAFYRTALEDFDTEDASTFFQPDMRAMPYSGRFR